jgi:hypothetical protein
MGLTALEHPSCKFLSIVNSFADGSSPKDKGVCSPVQTGKWQMTSKGESAFSLTSGKALYLRPYEARLWWLTPVILATQEADIGRLRFKANPGQIVHETLS